MLKSPNIQYMEVNKQKKIEKQKKYKKKLTKRINKSFRYFIVLLLDAAEAKGSNTIAFL